jgi:putative ABC transport system substrate-binding protein
MPVTRTIIGLGVMPILLLVASVAAEAQPATKIPRIGHLFFGTPRSDPAAVEGLRRGLRDLGYVENQNIVIEYRYAEGKPERLPRLIGELINLKVDVLLAQGTAVTAAAKQGTTTTPVVSVTLDPVGSGLVQSLARPGGNITGLSFAHGENFTGKWLGLVKEMVPEATRVGIIWNPANKTGAADVKEMEALAPKLGLRLSSHPVQSPEEIDAVFSTVTRAHVAALIVETDPFVVDQRARIVRLAAASRIPTIYGLREFVEAGGLMSYGANLFDLWRRTALYVDKILKGTKPADLPIEQSTKFELVINLKTAKMLGLTIPPSLLLQADQVIE